jgi:hypothetical protein
VGNNILVSQGVLFEFNYKDFFEIDGGVRYSLNSARYSLEGQEDLDYSSWAFTNNSRLDLKDGWVFRYDFEYTLNEGLAPGVNQNLAILNASLEKAIFKKKNGFLKLSAFDIFNQNTSITRTVNGNYITDTRTNRLTRYIMLTFTYRLNRFQGQQQQQGTRQPGMDRQMRQF